MKLSILPILTSCLAAFGSLSFAALAATSEVEVRTFPAVAGDTLVVENDRGRVRIRTWEQDRVEARIRRSAPSEEQLGAVQVRATRQEGRISVRSDFESSEALALIEIHVPRHLSVAVWALDSGVDLADLEGPVRVVTASGLIEARSLTGAVSLMTGSGSILLDCDRQPLGDIKLESLQGDIRCTVRFGLQLHTWARAGGTLFRDGVIEPQQTFQGQSGSMTAPWLHVVSLQGNVQMQSVQPSAGRDPADASRTTPGAATAEVPDAEVPDSPRRRGTPPVLVESLPRPESTGENGPGISDDGAATAPPMSSAAEDIAPGDVPSFRVDVDWVYLNVSVRDRATNRSIPGLQRRDFQVLEDSVEQRIERFEPTEAPIHLLLLLDVSGSTRDVIDQIRSASIEFTRQIKENDRIAIAIFNSRVRLILDFTNDRRRVARAIQGIHANGGTAFYDALYTSVTDYMSRVDGRKAIVVFSDGEDNRLTGDIRGGSRLSFEELYREIQEIDSIIYTIFLQSERDRSISSRRGRTVGILGDILSGRIPGSGGRGSTRSKRKVIEEAKRQLGMIAEQTGGRMYAPRFVQDLYHVYGEIADDLRIQYTLAYNSSNPARDGKWRRVQVRMDRTDLVARTRKGYYARSR